MKENNYKPQLPDVMEAVFDAAYTARFSAFTSDKAEEPAERIRYIAQ